MSRADEAAPEPLNPQTLAAVEDDDILVVDKIMSLLPDGVSKKRRDKISSILRNHLPRPKSLKPHPGTRMYRLGGRPWFRMQQDLSHALILMHLSGMEWEVVMFTLQETIGRNRAAARIGREWLANATLRSDRNVATVRSHLIERGILLEVVDVFDPESTSNARLYQIQHDWTKWDWSDNPHGLRAMQEIQRTRLSNRNAPTEHETVVPEVSDVAEQLCAQLWQVLHAATGGHAMPRQDDNAYYKWTLAMQRLIDGEITGVAATAAEIQVTLHTIQRNTYWMERLVRGAKNAGVYFVEHFAELRAGAATTANATKRPRPQ